MNPLDETLVREVFGRMVKARPSLARHLSAIDEDEDEGKRVRFLAGEMISGFPWPIGIELRRLFKFRNLDRGRLDQLFRAIERTMQLLSYILLSQFLEEVISKRARTSAAFRDQFPGRFSVTTMGNFAWLVKNLGTLFQEQQITPFAGELKDVLGKPFYSSLEFWSPERNDIGHYLINLPEEEIENRCVEYGERLTSILANLAFLVAYPLVTVREIRVLKRKRREASFSHSLDILNSSYSDFDTREENLETFCDSPAVLLMKDLKRPREFLNLSPLVIDTRSEVRDAQAKFPIKKDIFLFSKLVEGKPRYVGTEVTGKIDLSLISTYSMLKEEFEELLCVLAVEEVA